MLYKTCPKQRETLSTRVSPRKPSGLEEVMAIVGGVSRDGLLSEVLQYNRRTDEWRLLSYIPTPRYGLGACCCNGTVYTSGGCSAQEDRSSIVECYSIRDNEWSTLPSLQTERKYHSMVAHHEMLYVVGGQGSQGVLSSVEIYVPGTLAWQYATSLSSPRMYHQSVVLDNRVVVLGGHDGSCRLDSIQYLHDSRWVTTTTLPVPLSVFGAAVVKDRLYIAGGYNGKKYLDTAHYYDNAVGEWHVCPSMTVPRSAFGMTNYGGKPYSCSGFTGNFTNSGEHLQEQKWTAIAVLPSPRVHFGIVAT